MNHERETTGGRVKNRILVGSALGTALLGVAWR